MPSQSQGPTPWLPYVALKPAEITNAACVGHWAAVRPLDFDDLFGGLLRYPHRLR